MEIGCLRHMYARWQRSSRAPTGATVTTSPTASSFRSRVLRLANLAQVVDDHFGVAFPGDARRVAVGSNEPHAARMNWRTHVRIEQVSKLREQTRHRVTTFGKQREARTIPRSYRHLANNGQNTLTRGRSCYAVRTRT